jgi:glycosyltransferase involved in cell wall biosynthesis
VSEMSSDAIASPRVSVVICTRNRPDKICAAAESVLANGHPNFDVTVIDQSTTDATQYVLGQMLATDKRVSYHHMNAVGLSRAYNLGIRSTSADLIAFTDDDCIVPADWLEHIERAFAEEPDADLLYGQVVAKPAALDDGALVPDLPFTKAERLSRRDGFRVFGMGANFAARRRLFDRIGGFDEVLGGGAPLRSSQDFDLAYRTYRAGAVILLRPEVTLLHDGGREPDEWHVVMHNYGVGDGAFYSKHVRCRDPYALLLLIRKISRLGAGAAIKAILGQRPRADYLTGILVGVRDGRRFSVDRRQRLYTSV